MLKVEFIGWIFTRKPETRKSNKSFLGKPDEPLGMAPREQESASEDSILVAKSLQYCMNNQYRTSVR